MKMTFALPNGRQVSAYFDQELLELLRQDGLGGPPVTDVATFMEQTAQRLQAQQGQSFATISARHFLFDLQRHEVLRPVTNPWVVFALDGIQEGLKMLPASTGWRHQLIWSSELPYVVSTHLSGAARHSPIHLSQLAAPTPTYQAHWLHAHKQALNRLA